MKYIIEGGISTRNVPKNTKDAILLAIHSDFLSGVSLNLYPTKDNKIVTFATPTVDNGKEKISDLTHQHLQRRNFGNRVSRHSILELSEILKLFENASTKEILMFNLEGNNHKKLFLDNLINMTNQYPNLDIYIKTMDQTSLKYLKENAKKQRIGPIVSEKAKDLWEDNFAFYVIEESVYDRQKIKRKIEDNKRIMIQNINSIERYREIYKDLKQIDTDIYIISDTTSNIASIYLSTNSSARL